MLCIYADYKSDESYTPSKISVRVGNNFHNLQEIRVTTELLFFPLKFMRSLFETLTVVIVLLFLTAAAGDGGAQRLDSHLTDEPGQLFKPHEYRSHMNVHKQTGDPGDSLLPPSLSPLSVLQRTNEPISTFMIQIAVLANHQNGRDTHMRQIKVYTPVEESSIGKFPRCTTVDFMMYRTIR